LASPHKSNGDMIQILHYQWCKERLGSEPTQLRCEFLWLLVLQNVPQKWRYYWL